MKSTLLTVLLLIGMAIHAQQITRIGIIGCHNQHGFAPAIPYMANQLKPEFVIWVGDNVYADTETDPEHIRKQLEVLEQKDGFAELRAGSQFLVTWDDHDYGLNNAGKDYPFKKESLAIHREFWELEKAVPAEQDGIYNAYMAALPNGKRLQFIMLDARYNRDKPGRNADALGENQWKWLEEQLKQPADFRILVSGQQVLINRPSRWEAWAKLGRSRDRLIGLLKTHKVDNAIFITGDQHYVEVLRSPKNIDFKTIEIMAAGINKNERPGMAANRIGKADIAIHNAPLLEIHWTAEPYIHFRNYHVQSDVVGYELRWLFSDIGWK